MNRGGGWFGWLAILAALLLWWGYKTSKKDAAVQAQLTAQAPAEQREFHAKQKEFRDAFKAGKNEIQKSAVFSQATNWTKNFFSKHRWRIEHWAGTISSLKTSHGGEAVDYFAIHGDLNGLTIRYINKGNIPKGGALYKQLSSLSESDSVTFDCRMDSGTFHETSFTESGRMTMPSFQCAMSNVKKF